MLNKDTMNPIYLSVGAEVVTLRLKEQCFVLEKVPRGLPCDDCVLWLVTHVQLLLLVPYSILLEHKMVNWCVQLWCNGTWIALFTVPQSTFQIHTRTHSHTNGQLLPCKAQPAI